MFHENISMAEYPQFIHGIFAFIHIHFILKLHRKFVVILVEYIVNAIVISAKPHCLFYFHTKSHKNVRNQNRITFSEKYTGFSCCFVEMIEINSSQCSFVWHLPFAWISSNRWKIWTYISSVADKISMVDKNSSISTFKSIFVQQMNSVL